MRIEVTAEDIAAGIVGHSQACPVALALKRVTGRTWDCGMTNLCDFQGSGWSWPAPLAVRDWINTFDHRYPVAPFTFDLPERS